MHHLSACLIALWQIAIPPPRGFVNDFAGVLDSASIARMDQIITEVRAKTGGDIAVVTLPDIGDRAAADVAVQIGREWGVGGKGEAGDPKKNLGVVILVVPRKNHRPGSGAVFIATGRGAEGFLPDARVGRIRDAMTPDLAREDYDAGLETGVGLVAQAFASQFGVSISGAGTQSPEPEEPRGGGRSGGSPLLFLLLLLLVILLTRGRIFPWLLLGALSGRSSRSGGFGGGGWGGGGGGGGFGGFGGGGGFSGGGAGGSF